MAKRTKVKIGKISTGGWVAIAAAGAIGVYLVTRPKTTPGCYSANGTLYPSSSPYSPPILVPGNNTASSIANDVTSIFNSIFS